MSFCKISTLLLVSAGLWLAGDFSAGPLAAADKGKAKANPKVKSGGTVARWAITADPPAEMIQWPDTLKFTIPQPQQRDDVLFSSTQSEFCLTNLKPYESDGAELWDLSTGKRIGIINGSPVKAIKRALSPDGKYLAILSLNQQQTKDCEVWSTESGKRLSTFTADDPMTSCTILDFAGSGEVLTYTFGQLNGKFVYHLRTWDAATGKPVQQMDLDKNISGDTRYDISPGRKWLATLIASDVVLYDLASGQPKVTITPPAQTEDGKFVHIDSVRFSQDGSELATLSGGSDASVLAVYDMTTGEIKVKHELPASSKAGLQHPSSYKGPHIEFVAQPNGFLWYGSGFVERESGMMIWTYKQGQLEYNHSDRILTPAGLITSTGGSAGKQLQVLPFPAEKLKKTVEAYNSGAPALVKPGEKVKVTIKVTEVRFGKPDEAKAALEGVLTDRLADDGLEVGDDGSTTIAITYKEKAGKVLNEVKGGTPFGRGGQATGKTIQSTAAELTIKWTSKDGKTKIYEDSVDFDPSFLSIREPGDITDAKAREAVFDALKRQLSGLPMPYFVPEDKALSMLPVTTTSSMAPKMTAAEINKMKIEAKKKKTGK